MNEEKSESRRAVKLPSYPGLEKVHRANLRLLKEIDRICRKYKISYMLDSGHFWARCVMRDLSRGMMMSIWHLHVPIMRCFEGSAAGAAGGMSLLRPEEIRGGKGVL